MKNEKIISSWNKAEPDSATDERMLAAIIARNNTGRKKEGKVITMSNTIYMRRLAPVTACLVVILAVTLIIGNNAGWFGGNVYITDFGGNTLTFNRIDEVGSAGLHFGFEPTARDLTPEENRILFGDLDVASYGLFNPDDGRLVHVEGSTGNTKIILAAHGIPVTDAVIETNRESSEINGILVSAGYFTTRASSQGIRNIIYVASFEVNGVQVHVECGGNQDASEAWRSEIAVVIDSMTNNQGLDISTITE